MVISSEPLNLEGYIVLSHKSSPKNIRVRVIRRRVIEDFKDALCISKLRLNLRETFIIYWTHIVERIWVSNEPKYSWHSSKVSSIAGAEIPPYIGVRRTIVLDENVSENIKQFLGYLNTSEPSGYEELPCRLW